MNTPSITLLSSDEILLANKKQNLNKVVFAALLKFYEQELFFPTNSHHPSLELLLDLYQQLIDPTQKDFILQNYNWKNRSTQRFRQEIRKFFGFRLFMNSDKKILETWLIENAFTQGMRLKKSKRKTFDFFKQNKIELIEPKILHNYVHSSYLKFDKDFLCNIHSKLNKNTVLKLKKLWVQENEETQEINEDLIRLKDLKKDPVDTSLNSIEIEVKKLNFLNSLSLPHEFFSQCNYKLLKKYYLKILQIFPSEINKIALDTRYAFIALFCYVAGERIIDNFTEILLQRLQRIEVGAESHVGTKLFKQVIKTEGKMDILLKLASIAVASPQCTIEQAIYPAISQEALQNLVTELQCKGKWYEYQVKKKMRSLYSHYHRRLLLILIEHLEFKSSHAKYENLLKAIEYIKCHSDDENFYQDEIDKIPTDVIGKDWRKIVFEEVTIPQGEENHQSKFKINRFYYELAVFDKLRRHINCKNIWIVGARKYRDPNEDLPKDWNNKRPHYYKLLNQPEDSNAFITPIKKLMHESLLMLNDNLPENKRVKIIKKRKGSWIKITPSKAQDPPKNLERLHREIEKRWQSISLLDILKEVDLDVGFTDEMMTELDKQMIDETTLRKRLLLAIYGIGTNMGLKAVQKGNADVSYSDLRYAKRSTIENTGIRYAISQVINRLLEIRDPAIWGNDTMSCICDSTLVKVMDQNFVAQWHPRYKEKGIMIYWHVEKGAACIYSQLKTCLSSEVGSMMEGRFRHNTKKDLNKAYMDTHGQSLPGFGFSYLLNISLLPRLKNIYRQKLYYVNKGEDKNYPNLALILEDAIDWDLIEENYDAMMQYAVSLKLGLTEADVIMKRFSKDNYANPVYQAICELGKAIKTIFLCRYLASEELRIEIHEALNIVERVNGFMHFILFGKLGAIYSNQKEEQEKIILCLHLIQVCLGYVNTLLIQEVLSDPIWEKLLTQEDRRALSLLIYGHVNPYGLFSLNMDERLPLKSNQIRQQLANRDNKFKGKKKIVDE